MSAFCSRSAARLFRTLCTVSLATLPGSFLLAQSAVSPAERASAELAAQLDVKRPWVPPVKTDARESRTDPRTPTRTSSPVVPPVVASDNGVRSAPTTAGAHASRRAETIHYDELGDGSLWVRGHDYKARFDRHGFAFTPCLGSHAPRNFPVACQLVEVSVGGVALPLADDSAPARMGGTVVRERGALTETYTIQAGAIEQSFVLSRELAAGDVLIRLAVETELEPAASARGLRFANAWGGVDCRDAVVIDSAGRRLEIELARGGSSIELRVPASFLEQAAWPVTIDPLWSTFSIDTTALDDFAPDVSHDASVDTWIACYEEVFSASDHDVYEEHLDLSGNLISGGYIDSTSADWRHPRVANNNFANQYLIVAAVGDPAGGARVIKGRTVNGGSSVYSPVFQISGVEAGDKLDPDVGGDAANVSPSYYCVVWSRVAGANDRDVHARLVKTDGTLLGAGTILLDNSAGTLDTVPDISKSDGAPPFVTQEWNVVWQRRFAVGDEDIYGAQVHWNGVITTPTFAIDTSSNDDTNPTVTPLLEEPAGTRDYLVVWERDFTTDHDIVGRAFNAATMLDYINLSVAEGVYYTFDQREPAADSDGESFVIAYTQDTAPDHDPLAATLQLVGTDLVLGEGVEWLTNANSEQRDPQVACSRSSGGERARCLIVYESDDGTDGDIQGSLYDLVPYAEFCDPASPGVIDCPCGNFGSAGHGCASSSVVSGARLSATGLSSPESIVLHGSFMPANSTCIYLQGSALTNVIFGDGVRCAGGTLIRLYTKINVAGASHCPEAGDPSVSSRGMVTPGSGDRRFYQVYYRDPAAFCGSATFNASQAVQIVW